MEIEHSPTIAKLAEALNKAQAAMGTAAKSSTNPHFKSKYADFASVLDAVREPLASNGLSFVQIPGNTEGGVSLATMVIHTSGEWIRGVLTMPADKQTAQAYGSAITYARRYALSSMLGVAADEDDDGNAASAKVMWKSPVARGATPTKDPGITIKPDERAPSEAELLRDDIEACQSIPELQKLVTRIQKLSEADKAIVRAPYAEKTKELA